MNLQPRNLHLEIPTTVTPDNDVRFEASDPAMQDRLGLTMSAGLTQSPERLKQVVEQR